MALCPDAIKKLVDRFTEQSDEIRSPDYKEHLIRVNFLDPLMKELGWDVHNTAGLPLKGREVYPEDSVQIGGQTNAPDYSFRVGEHRKFFLEAKKPSVNIKENWEPACQLRSYGWSAELAVSVLSDFEEFAVYDTRIRP